MGFQIVCSGIGWSGWIGGGLLAMGGGKLAELARRVSIVCRELLSVANVSAWRLESEVGVYLMKAYRQCQYICISRL